MAANARRAGLVERLRDRWRPAGGASTPHRRLTDGGDGRPLIVAVASGRGGSGRSTVAHGLAALLGDGPGGGRVVLVEGDFDAPDLDLRTGGGQPTLADLLDALPALAAGEGDVDGYLARDRDSRLRVVLAPDSPGYADGIGPEHLDYVLTYVLAPRFGLVIVDCGGLAGAGTAGGRAATFWIQRADLVLVPFRGEPAGLRDVDRLRNQARRLGVASEAVLPILNGDRPRRLRAAGVAGAARQVAFDALPWAPDAALRAQLAGLALSRADAACGRAFARLASRLEGALERRVLPPR